MRSFNHTVSEKIIGIIIYIILALACVAAVFPFFNIIAVSLSEKSAVITGRVTFYPINFTFAAYQTVIMSPFFFSAYSNTLFVVVAGTTLSLILTIFASFPLSRSDLPGKTFITFIITLTMWFSGGMIPTFLVVRNIGLYDSLFALFIPTAISAFNVIVMRNFFKNIPDSLEEAAIIDGANDLTVLFYIIVPLSMPVIATITLWLAVGYWNSFMPALLYLQTRSKFTLQLVLRDIVLANTIKQYMDVELTEDKLSVVSDSLKYANIIMTTLPILLVYPFLQKYFIKGVLIGAIKG